MEKYEKAIVAIKEKYAPVVNADMYKPSDVLVELEKRGLKNYSFDCSSKSHPLKSSPGVQHPLELQFALSPSSAPIAAKL